MSSATQKIKDIVKRLEKTLKQAVSKNEMGEVGKFALNLIVKRTRLGYGVEKTFGSKYAFPSLSPNYIKFRRKFERLSGTTSAAKSNVTLTGQLLASMRVTSKQGSFIITPTGSRSDSPLSNLELADILETKGRIFNRLSLLEYQQTLRYYRKSFGDLLAKQRLLR